MFFQLPVGAVIVDPTTNTVIAKSHDKRKGDNPLQHAAMVAVDLVARAQGGGMWNISGMWLRDGSLFTILEHFLWCLALKAWERGLSGNQNICKERVPNGQSNSAIFTG